MAHTMVKLTYVFAAFIILLTGKLLAMELRYFDLETIKSAIKADQSNGATIMRMAFPEDEWKKSKKGNNPNKYFELITPLKSLEKIYSDVASYNLQFALRPHEQKWLSLHRRLHNLIVDTAIAEAAKELKPTASELIAWQAQYMSFFFAPLSGSHRGKDSSDSSYCHIRYTDQSDICPTWMKENLNKHRIAGSYGTIYDELREINEAMGQLNSFTYINDRSEGLLKKYGYYMSLLTFAEKFFSLMPANCKLNMTTSAFATAIGSLLVEKPSIKDLYMHNSLSSELLNRREEFYCRVEKTKCLLLTKETCQFNFDIIEKAIKKYLHENKTAI